MESVTSCKESGGFIDESLSATTKHQASKIYHANLGDARRKTKDTEEHVSLSNSSPIVPHEDILVQSAPPGIKIAKVTETLELTSPPGIERSVDRRATKKKEDAHPKQNKAIFESPIIGTWVAVDVTDDSDEQPDERKEKKMERAKEEKQETEPKKIRLSIKPKAESKRKRRKILLLED